MRTRIALALAAATLLAVPAPAPAEHLDRGERAAVQLLNLAERRVVKDDDGCRPRPPARTPKPAMTDADPSATFTSVLSIYRRPPTADELEAAGDRRGPFGMEMPGTEEVYRRGVRFLRSHAGDRFTVRIASRVRWSPVIDPATRARCNEAVRARLDDFDRPRGVVRTARRILSEMQEREAKHLAETPEVGEGLALAYSPRGNSGAGGTGTIFDPERFRKQGMWMSMGGGPRGRVKTRLAGLVPDGVATITFEFRRFGLAPRGHRGHDYGSRATLTAAVRQNVISVVVPRGGGDAFPLRMVWRGPDGKTVNVVRYRL